MRLASTAWPLLEAIEGFIEAKMDYAKSDPEWANPDRLDKARDKLEAELRKLEVR